MASDVRAPSDTAALRLAELTEQHAGSVPDEGNIRDIARRNVAAILPRPRLPRPRLPRRVAPCPGCGKRLGGRCTCDPT